MASHIGAMKEYDEGKEDFSTYLERLDQWYDANDINDGKKVSVFISLIGSTTYQVLKDLCAPDLHKTKTFDELTRILSNHFEP